MIINHSSKEYRTITRTMSKYTKAELIAMLVDTDVRAGYMDMKAVHERAQWGLKIINDPMAHYEAYNALVRVYNAWTRILDAPKHDDVLWDAYRAEEARAKRICQGL